jgi:hypothetical protein
MYEIKKTAQDMKEAFTNIRKISVKESNRNPGNKSLLKSNKEHS